MCKISSDTIRIRMWGQNEFSDEHIGFYDERIFSGNYRICRALHLFVYSYDTLMYLCL